MYNPKTKVLAALAGLGLSIGMSANTEAGLLVYEGFQYNNIGAELIGLPDDPGVGDVAPIGLASTWADASATSGTVNDMYIKSGSLEFSNLATTGNHIGFSSNSNSDRYHNALDSAAQTGIDNAGAANGKLYISFLFEKLQNSFGADHEGLALMNEILPQARWDSGNVGAVGRHGFAIAATNNSNLRAVAYDGTTGTRVVSSGALTITTVNGGTNTSTSNQEVAFIVVEISFNTGTAGADVMKLYAVTDDGNLDVTDLATSASLTIEANVDETTLNTLNLTRQVNVNYDEVRIGTELADVIPVPEPSSLALLGLGGLLIASRRRG